MKDIYQWHIQGDERPRPAVYSSELGNRPILTGESALHGYTRDAANEIDAIFPGSRIRPW